LRKIDIRDAQPGMILAREIMSYTGIVLLAQGVVLTQDYLKKLFKLHVLSIFIVDPLYEGIESPEYIRPEVQQHALVVLNQTIKDLHNKGTFAVKTIANLANDLVEELLHGPEMSICVTGIYTHDDTTFAHSLNCAIFAVLLGRFSNLSIPKLKELASGALLHDVGKNDICAKLLNKPGKLNDDEFELIKTHTQWGFDRLHSLRWELSSLIAHMAWQHHEHVDGTGYPRGLTGDNILYQARIIAIADVYEAVTADRPYRQALEPKQAYEIIRHGLGTHFDAQLAQNFISKVALYSPGTSVIISTGQTALIVSIPPLTPHRPIIRIVTDPEGHPCKPYELNLAEKPLIQIMRTK